jgi:gamma-glutamyltranspeptidase/glutathione hydrolase
VIPGHDIRAAPGRAEAEGAAVATAAVPAALEAALEAYADGGNAFDAAVAAALVETVWLPMKCGLAGDVVALFRAADGPVSCLLSVGSGARALDTGVALPETGPASVGIPGAPAGYARLAARGRLGLARLVAPARAQAEAGVAWHPVAVALTREAEPLLRRWNGAIPFLPGGSLPEIGAPLVLPGLAELLGHFAGAGEALFHGRIGALVERRLTPQAGLLRAEDLRTPCARVAEPEATDLPGGRRLLATPHPTEGAVLGDALAGLVAAGKEADEVAALAAARRRFGAGSDGGTSVVTAADGEGNTVVLVHSNSYPQYGSGVVLEDFDLVLNNRPGRGFASGAPHGHWNAPRAGRTPATTLQAWMLEEGSGRWREHWGATPGGQNQAAWNLQAIRALLADGPAAAARGPRWALGRGGSLSVEADHPGREPIRERHGAATVPPASLRSVVQILSRPREGERLSAVADPRTGAAAGAAGPSRS